MHFNLIAQIEKETTYPYTIDIYVVDSRNKLAIPNANVLIYGMDSSRKEYITDTL